MYLSLIASLMFLATTVVSMAGDNMPEIERLFALKKTTQYPVASSPRMQLMPGQWTMYAMMDDDQEKSIYKTSIISIEGDNVTMETMILNEDDKITTQYVIAGMLKARESGNTDDLDILLIKIKRNDDDVVVVDGFALSIAKGMYKDALKTSFAPNAQSTPAGEVVVAAGTFAGTVMVHSEVEFLGNESVADSWMHGSVPISGLLKSKTEDGYTMELLDFGTTGATSSF